MLPLTGHASHHQEVIDTAAAATAVASAATVAAAASAAMPYLASDKISASMVLSVGLSTHTPPRTW